MAGDASRANGARSRGPRTAQGKARSSQNARRHGLRSVSRAGSTPASTARMGLCHALSILARTSTSLPAFNLSGSSSGSSSRPGSTDIPPDLLAATIAFAEADDVIVQCQALKALARNRSLLTTTMERTIRASWLGLCEACEGTDPDTPLHVHAKRAGLGITNIDINTLRTASGRDHMAALKRSFSSGKGAHLWFSDVDARVAASAACAHDCVLLDRYQNRAVGRRRKAMKVMRRYAALARSRLTIRERDEIDAAVYAGVVEGPSLPKLSFNPEDALEGMRTLTERLSPINDLGQVVHGHVGLQYAVCVRFEDLCRLSRQFDDVFHAAADLGHFALCCSYAKADKTAVLRIANFFCIASKVLDIASIPAVREALIMPKRDPKEQAEIYQAIVRGLDELDAARYRTYSSDDVAFHKNVTNEPEEVQDQVLDDMGDATSTPIPDAVRHRNTFLPNEPEGPNDIGALQEQKGNDQPRPVVGEERPPEPVLPNEPDGHGQVHGQAHGQVHGHGHGQVQVRGQVQGHQQGHVHSNAKSAVVYNEWHRPGLRGEPLIKPPPLTTQGPAKVFEPDRPWRPGDRNNSPFFPPHDAPRTPQRDVYDPTDPPRSPYGIRLENPNGLTPRHRPVRRKD